MTESEVVAMEQATAVDTERRRYLEDKAAVSKAFDLSRDPSERAAKLSEFEKKYTGYQHKDPRVQAVVKGFLSTELPQTKSYFEGLNLDVRRKNLEVEAKRNEEGLYRAGDQQAFAISVFKQVELGMIDQPTKDAKIAAFPANSAVAQMKDAVLNNDLAGATRLAAETKKLPLTLGQKADVAELEGVIEQAKKEGDSQARVAVLMAANEAAALPEGQKYVERKRLKAEYAATGPTPADYREMSNWVDSRLKGEEPKVDPMAEIEADEAIRTISDESTQQEKKAVRDQILGLASRLGPKVAGYIKDLDDRLDVVNTGTVTLAVETAVARGLPDTDAPIVRRGIEKYVRSLKGNVDPADVMAYGAKLAVIAKSRQRELFTPEAKALAVGKLMAYDYPYAAKGQENGVPTFDEAVRFMQSTLGLDWVTLAPRAIEVLTERYPLDMWSRVPEAKRVEVIKDMVERARWQNKPTAALGTDALDKAQEIFGDPPQLT
ncbi:MAG: hypothetical protein IMZ62_10440, partial [Chloroflexi bacterium]|nr:hypothetical protein [Chloroflexota bacterium]